MKHILRMLISCLIVAICLSSVIVTVDAEETTELLSTDSKREGVTITIKYMGLGEKKIPESYMYLHPKTKELLTLELSEASYSPGVISGRTGYVQAEIDYGWQSTTPLPDNVITIDYYDNLSQKTVTANVSFNRLDMVENFRWLNDVEAMAVFEIYEAEYYLLEGSDIYIPYNNLFPEIGDQQQEIVKA
ncbi:MAG: hypothetical protein FWG21_00405, partial [Oscillospiraceae bacterium]|nr:hypothetical protein [Oscillospiraceae bacterium]